MTDCERLSDRMPEVARHRAAWTAEESAHLAECAECRAEWDLLLATRRLGERAPEVDAVAVAAAVRRRLATERGARRRARWIWAVAGSAAAAAAVAIAITTGPERDPLEAPGAVAVAEPLVPLPELEGLEATQLDTLLDSLEGPTAGSSTLESSTLGDGAESELERIFAAWEG